ncbi:putative tyrosine serine protein phosphatase protein [Zalerion maritima]|uniref:Tyrosine serine protein phosphatase protein n=1 Tax=Zalerion maritima TaxID=339359 RepID=A0AAD5WU30_9PEZI|nr:putative tyrosine serine protein phosphatase protein [Zalerion maritima]
MAAPALDFKSAIEQFDGILNFRDVGKTVNDFMGRKYMKEGVLYRSARPDEASNHDIDRLRQDYGIKTVMDLRTKTEQLKQNDKLNTTAATANSAVPAIARRRSSVAVPLQIPGLDCVQCPVTGWRFEMALLRRLALWDLLKFAFLFIFGRRVPAIRLLTKKIILPLGLIGSTTLGVRVSRREYLLSFRTVAKASNEPLLIHCTAGKDRTGAMIILILLLCEVPLEAIEHDYFVTSESGALESEWEERLKELAEFGFPEDWLGTPLDFVRDLISFIDHEWGSMDGYCSFIGFGSDERAQLRECLWA